MNTAKNLLQNGLFYLVLILCYFLYSNMADKERYKSKSELLEHSLNSMNEIMKETEVIYRDSIILYQAEVKELAYTANNLKARYEELLEASKLKAKDVNSMTQVVTQVVSKDTVYVEVDTFGGMKAQADDGFVNINVEVMKDKRAVIDYEMIDSISVIHVQKKHSILFGLIKWKDLKSTRVINHNPKAKIVDLQTFNVID